jgi:hypothetical protein
LHGSPDERLECAIVALSWTITPEDRLVFAVIEGTVTFADVEQYLEDVVTKGGLSYRKLIDARQGKSQIAESEFLIYAGRVKAYSQMARLGPMAVVAGEDKSHDHAGLFRALAANGNRPLSIFASIEQARAWLDHVAPVDGQ